MESKPSLISLFTGAGGLDLGMESAGFNTLIASELEDTYCETLRQNQLLGRMKQKDFSEWFEKQILQKCYRNMKPEEILDLKQRVSLGVGKQAHLHNASIVPGDIRNLDSETILKLSNLKRGKIDIVVGGPPCQPFSRAGKRQTVETSDGRLFKEFVRIVDDVRPRWFLFENVKGLAQSKTEIARFNCNKCNHSFIGNLDERDKAVSESLKGIACPQCSSKSLRYEMENVSGGSLFLILEEFKRLGYTCHHKLLSSADFGVPQTRERLFIVGSRDNEEFNWPTPTHSKFESEIGLKPWVGMHEAIWSHGHYKYGKINKNKAVLWVKNVVRPHDEPVTWHLDRPSPTIGAHQSAKLAIAPKGVPEAQIFRQQWHTLGRRQGDSPPVNVEHAYLSDRELLLLQSFPEYWYLHGTRMERAFQIGNAVPPKFAEVIGNSILESMGIKKKSNIYQKRASYRESSLCI
ncbi:MAG: DNA cytosine methyltransferase [Bdellovibrionia bacterium]